MTVGKRKNLTKSEKLAVALKKNLQRRKAPGKIKAQKQPGEEEKCLP